MSLEASPSNQKNPLFSGFVAMEYYALILNRTFVVFVSSEGLYGWKAAGAVTARAPLFYEPLAEMLNDPELMIDRDAVRELSQEPGGFFIPRSEISSVDVIEKQKWGMGSIPHSGRILLHLVSGKSRELILLGSADAESIKQHILGG